MSHKAKMKRVRRVEKAAKKIMRMGTVYLRGGARGAHGITPPPGPGLPWTDCSGADLYLAAVANLPIKAPNGYTGTAVLEGEDGESEYFTFFIKDPYEHEHEGHMILRLRHHPLWRRALGMAAKWRWLECGGSDNPKSGGGLTYFKPTDDRVAEFPYRRRFAGF